MSIPITTKMVKELRDRTGISVMQCRKALTGAEGDSEKALVILKKNSAEAAVKKADRTVADGRVAIKTSPSRAVMVALQCETDFVARNEDFVALLEVITDKVLSGGTMKIREDAPELINPVIQKVGEKIELGEIFEVEGNTLGTYVHSNNKLGVIVSLEGGSDALARDIAMHVAAMKPEYVSREEIPDSAREMVAEVAKKELEAIDKPEEIKQKILEGKVGSYFKERTLLEQPFIKNPEQTIATLLEAVKAKVTEIKKCYI